MKKLHLLAIFGFLFFSMPVLSAETAQTALKAKGPLAEYVAKKDDSFSWYKKRTGVLGKTPYVELILTSQTWRGIVWKHQLFILKPTSTPANVHHALLFISGGNWKDKYENNSEASNKPREAKLFALMAEQMKTPVAVLLHVPQQPIFDGKVEDQIIAHTFDQYLKTNDSEWPLLLPMVKSAVRGMDAVQEFSQQQWKMQLKTFTVTGASKRGWTTWLTGAVDPRVTSIAPMVIDVLNMGSQLTHQEKVWGKISYQIGDYSKLDLPARLRTEKGKALRAIVDPYNYLHLLTQPKLIIIGTNDHYWPLDALNLYWDDLIGEKHILYIPNNRHGLKDYIRVVGSLNALHQLAATGKELPKLKWSFRTGEKKLRLSIKSDINPDRIDVWLASSPSRDFRQAKWYSLPTIKQQGKYTYDLDLPKKGFSAIFGEAVYETDKIPFFLSTNVRIISADGVANQ